MYTLNTTEVHAVCIGVDCYNGSLTGAVSMTLTAKTSDAHHVPCVLVLNDQGGGIMAVSYDKTNTLRAQEHGHPPLVLIEMTSTKNTIVLDEISPTLTARMGTGGNQVNAVLIERKDEDLHGKEIL